MTMFHICTHNLEEREGIREIGFRRPYVDEIILPPPPIVSLPPSLYLPACCYLINNIRLLSSSFHIFCEKRERVVGKVRTV